MERVLVEVAPFLLDFQGEPGMKGFREPNDEFADLFKRLMGI